MDKSEFGKGLVICLVKFAEHRHMWEEQREHWMEMHRKNPSLLSMSDAVESHFNGASDHLYEIDIPEEWKNTEVGRMIKQLQDYGLEMGHGFTRRDWTEEDVNKAYGMCQEIALLIDKKLGLKPDIGLW